MTARRILYVSSTAPEDRSYGGALRGGLMLEALRRCGEVRTLVMTPGNHDAMTSHPDPAVLACITFRHRLPPFAAASVPRIRSMVVRALQDQPFDLVVVRYLLLGLYVRPCVDAPFVLDADDLSKRHARESAPLVPRLIAGGRKLARDAVARRQLPCYAHVWFVNEADRIGFPVPSGSLLPNVAPPLPAVAADRSAPGRGGDAGAKAVQVPDAPAPQVLFVGNLEYGPNVQAVDYFVAHCWPALQAGLPPARLRIVGKRSAANAARWNAVAGVQSPGFVDDLAGEYARAGVVVAPVFSGGGTQIKVLEALALARAVVVSDFVCAGFRPTLEEGAHFLVARAPAQWVDHCLALLRDRPRAQALGLAGQRAVQRHHSPESFMRTVAAAVAPLLA